MGRIRCLKQSVTWQIALFFFGNNFFPKKNKAICQVTFCLRHLILPILPLRDHAYPVSR